MASLISVLCTSKSRLFACVFAIAVSIATTSGNTAAENFRIETKVYQGDAEEPVSQTTTLFCNGVVYDFLHSPAQTAVFSKPNGKNPGRFVLLNDDEQIRTQISTDRLQGAMTDLRTWAAKQTDPFLKFAANPKFEESFEPGNGQLVLASHLESYTVHTTPAKNPKGAAEYREFLDWYAQLNTLLTGGPPPQPRLELNESLSRHKATPATVELRRAGEKEPLRAEHQFTWLLSQDDMSRIENVRGALASYREVTNPEYRRLSDTTNDAE